MVLCWITTVPYIVLKNKNNFTSLYYKFTTKTEQWISIPEWADDNNGEGNDCIDRQEVKRITMGCHRCGYKFNEIRENTNMLEQKDNGQPCYQPCRTELKDGPWRNIARRKWQMPRDAWKDHYWTSQGKTKHKIRRRDYIERECGDSWMQQSNVWWRMLRLPACSGLKCWRGWHYNTGNEHREEQVHIEQMPRSESQDPNEWRTTQWNQLLLWVQSWSSLLVEALTRRKPEQGPRTAGMTKLTTFPQLFRRTVEAILNYGCKSWTWNP